MEAATAIYNLTPELEEGRHRTVHGARGPRPRRSKPESAKQQQAVKRRRKRPALFRCTFRSPDSNSHCYKDFTTEYRLKSKLPPFPSLIPLSSTLFLKSLMPQLAAHVKTKHEHIKNQVCSICGYKTGYKSDLKCHKRWRNHYETTA